MLRVGHELLGEAVCFPRGKSFSGVDERELLRFCLGIFLELGALKADLILEELALRTH